MRKSKLWPRVQCRGDLRRCVRALLAARACRPASRSVGAYEGVTARVPTVSEAHTS